MKILRVLTGIHAGAQIKLDSITLRLGADEEADIRLSDWHAPSLVLSFNEQGMVQLDQIPEAPSAAPLITDTETDTTHMVTAPITLNDLMPMKFGEIVLCVGHENASWPNDEALLSLLAQPAKVTQSLKLPSSRLRLLLMVTGGVVLSAALIAAVVIWQARRTAQIEYQTKVNTPANQMRRALAKAGIAGIEVVPHDNFVALQGIVPTVADDITVRRMIDQLNTPGKSFAPNYDVAVNIAQNIVESLGIPGVKAQYAGAGVFQVVGAVTDLEQAQQALEKLKPDFSGNVKRIDSLMTQAPPNDPNARYSVFMSSSGVRFVVTPDGVKHLYPSDPSKASEPTGQE